MKGAYEFIPGSAAGVFRSGDPWLDLNAALRIHSELKAHIGLSSAAWLRGLKPRAPSRHIIFAARKTKPPPSRAKVYTLVKTDENCLFGAEKLHGLPVATIERLFVEAVWRPDLLNLRSDAEWLLKIIADANPVVIAEFLGRLSIISVWSRAGYLAEIVGFSELEDLILARFPSFRGPFYFGDSSRRDRYIAKWSLYDNVGLWKFIWDLTHNDY